MRAITAAGELVEVVSNVRLRDDQVRRTRALHMLAMRKAGQPVRAIALYFRITERHVRRELKSIPGFVERRIDGILV